MRAEEAGSFSQALTLFERTMIRYPDTSTAVFAARRGFRISYFENKDYQKAITFLRFIILKSKDPKERNGRQLELASIYFDHLQDYEKSLTEFGKLTSIPLNDADQIKVKFYMAQAYYHKNEFFQAKSEIHELLKKEMTPEFRFNVLMLQTNILVSERDWPKAIENYKKLIQMFPDKEITENLALNLSACYEENNDYKNAIAILEGLRERHSDPDYIDLRVKKIVQRSKNQPGARGFRK